MSPNGELQAVLFRRNCGATTAHSTQVTILKAGEKLPNAGGNAFVAEGEPPVIVRWVDNKHLIIDEPEGTTVIFRPSQVSDIQISDH